MQKQEPGLPGTPLHYKRTECFFKEQINIWSGNSTNAAIQAITKIQCEVREDSNALLIIQGSTKQGPGNFLVLPKQLIAPSSKVLLIQSIIGLVIFSPRVSLLNFTVKNGCPGGCHLVFFILKKSSKHTFSVIVSVNNFVD